MEGEIRCLIIKTRIAPGCLRLSALPTFAEQHSDTCGHYHKASDEGRKGTGIAGLWLVFYGLIIGVAVLGKAGATSAIEVACNYLK